MEKVLMETDLPLKLFKRGKVRDTYDLGDYLLMIATDRISTFDCVHPTGISDKGRILTKISCSWFEFIQNLGIMHHLVTDKVISERLPSLIRWAPIIQGRSMIIKKTKVIPIECVVRGYLYGSAWKEYQKRGSVSDIQLLEGLKQADKLPQPIFTPATKAETGHDENITFDEMSDLIGEGLACDLREISLWIYSSALEYAEQKGIIIADSKFEFGLDGDGEILVVDELLTPDSSRFWPADQYKPGGPQPSFDKQFVRDYVESIGWNKQPPAPELPDDIVQKTREKYIEALKLLIGQEL